MPAVLAVIERQSFIMGPEVGQLEAAVARLSDARHAIGCASGTDALLLPLQALDLQPGDEVITTAVHLLRHRGRRPQRRWDAGLRGHRPGHLQHLDPRRSRRPSRRAPAPSSPCTCSARWRRWSSCCRSPKRHGLALIEDAAQAIGARRKVDGAVAHGGRARHGRHAVVLPEQEPRRLRRRRHDGDAGRRARRAAAPAPAARRQPGSTSTTRSASTAGWTRCRRPCCWPSCPYLAAWSAAPARERRALHRGVRRRRRHRARRPSDPANEHIFHQYTIRVPRRDALLAHLKAQRHRPRGLLPAGAAPAALLRAPRLPGGQPAGDRARPRDEVVSLPVYPELTRGAAGRGDRRRPGRSTGMSG